jgi:Uncharacterized protein conserved in bacteria (DUF2325)
MPPLSAMLSDRPLLDRALTSPVGRPLLLPPAPIAPELEGLLRRPPRQRSKLWEFGVNLHCSIIGTCLTTAELRQVFMKLGRREVLGASDHDVHASAVLLAGKHQDGAKLLQKSLDRRHRAAIGQFDKAKVVAEVRALWRDASDRGDIPGAYWAALTHPACNESLVGEIFAEVHMLSHLVGAANRADIRRLRQLEQEKAELEARLARKEEQLLETSAARDEAVRALRLRVEPPSLLPKQPPDDHAVIQLKARITRCETRRERVEAELADTRAALSRERDARRVADQRAAELCEELRVLEVSRGEDPESEPLPHLELTLLYVGGKPARIGHLRELAERTGAVFLHHDGGIEERGGLLPGLVSRADVVLFPVDCVSHAATLQLKRLCRQATKKFLPLRSAGLAPFCAALRDPGLTPVGA